MQINMNIKNIYFLAYTIDFTDWQWTPNFGRVYSVVIVNSLRSTLLADN